jgi:hypothetical protein
MVLSSWSRASRCAMAETTLPVMMSHPSRRMTAATWAVNGPSDGRPR